MVRGEPELMVASDARLRRDLRLGDAVGVGLGAIIGGGIFVVTGIAAGMAGPSFLLGLVIAGCAATCNALSSAQLAATYPQSGGTYEYGYRLLGAWPGFSAGWMFLASKITAAGTVAIGLAGYLAYLVPGVHPRVLAVGAIVLFTALNYFGVRRTSGVNLVIVAASVGSLTAFIAAGVPSFDAENLRPFAPAGWEGVLQSAAILFFAYTGYARIATLAEEVRDPKRTIPRAIGLTIGASILLYLAVALVAVGVAGAAGLGDSPAPLAEAAALYEAPWMVYVVAAGGLTAMLGVILSLVLGLSRMVLAMARRRDLPALFAHVHPIHRIPRRAVLLVGAVAAFVAATGTLEGVAATAAFTILVYYGIANVCALRMPRKDKLFPDIVPGAGLLACIVLAASLPAGIVLTGAGVLAAGLLARALQRIAGGGRSG